MSPRIPLFSALWCIGYAIALGVERPLFYYYPLEGQWTLTLATDAAGPVMPWYGLLASAALFAVLSTVLLEGFIRFRQTLALSNGLLLSLALIPVIAMVATAALMLFYLL
ncbi:hypothetical protein NOR51B_2920 [Luminiphilus syltensis NOR5-1B]|uniref:Uncharacterized protein n=1 Tax=Luminiphilus syltensis NOR5-1B TaxID=565045 RepID=B8KSL2_9GAMM|nr:hypothetical protein [Luminiphilus syltensis]EED36967.1 hypothetical protein NOR51B_2920 [Luminiphilus syltensis NOR5-1B]